MALYCDKLSGSRRIFITVIILLNECCKTKEMFFETGSSKVADYGRKCFKC